MTAVTPLLFHVIAAREQSFSGLQRFRYGVDTEDYLRVDDSVELEGLSEFYPIREAMRPRSLRDATARGGPSVPLLAEHELRVLLSGAQPATFQAPVQQSWWDFFATADGQYAMFPGDDDPEPTLPVAFLVPNGLNAELRRVDLAALLGLRWGGRRRATVPPEPCGLDLDHDEEGAPYRGRCRRRGCRTPCSPLVVVNPGDGHYRLEGCRCAD